MALKPAAAIAISDSGRRHAKRLRPLYAIATAIGMPPMYGVNSGIAASAASSVRPPKQQQLPLVAGIARGA